MTANYLNKNQKVFIMKTTQLLVIALLLTVYATAADKGANP